MNNYRPIDTNCKVNKVYVKNSTTLTAIKKGN